MWRASSLLLLASCTFGGGSVGGETTVGTLGAPMSGSSGSADAVSGDSSDTQPQSDTTKGPSADTGGPTPPTSSTDGGDMGETTEGATGSSTGAVLPTGLVTDDLVVRYFLDESQGGIPNNEAPILDHGPGAPLNLSAIVVDDEPYYVTTDANRGVRWDATDSLGRVTAPVVGSKVAALDNTTELTIEFVAAVDGVNGEGTRFVHAGLGDQEHSFSVAARSMTSIEFRTSASNEQATFDVNLGAERTVFTAVFDLDRQSDPFLLFVNGVPYQPSNATALPRVITVDAMHSLTLGNRDNGDRSLRGAMHYAAIYRRALSEAEIQHNAALLATLDDEP